MLSSPAQREALLQCGLRMQPRRRCEPTQVGTICKRSGSWLRDGGICLFDSCQRYLHEEVGRGSLIILIASLPEHDQDHYRLNATAAEPAMHARAAYASCAANASSNQDTSYSRRAEDVSTRISPCEGGCRPVRGGRWVSHGAGGSGRSFCDGGGWMLVKGDRASGDTCPRDQG